MRRNNIETFIQKYNLFGTIESVTWHSTDDGVSVLGNTVDNQAYAFVDTDTIQLDSGEYSIYDTSQLKSLLAVLGGEINVIPSVENGVNTSLMITDKPYGGDTSVQFVLSDPAVIPNEPIEPDINPYDVLINIDGDFISKFTKVMSAISGIESFTVVPDNGLRFIVGYSDMNTTQIAIDVEAQGTLEEPIMFNSSLFRSILMANKEAKAGVIEISNQGAMRIKFELDGFNCRYFLARIFESRI